MSTLYLFELAGIDTRTLRIVGAILVISTELVLVSASKPGTSH
jgi:hypothetical protein